MTKYARLLARAVLIVALILACQAMGMDMLESGVQASAVTPATVNVSSVSLSKSSISLSPGKTYKLTASVSPKNATDKTLVWASSNPDVASVDETGLLTTKAYGTAIVSATASSGKKSVCAVTVKKILVSSVKLNKTKGTVLPEKTYQLTATVAPSGAENLAVEWASNNPAVATVSETGLVTTHNEGKAVIRVRAMDGSNKYASCTLTVRPIYVSRIKLNTSSLSMTPGTSGRLTAAVTPTTATYRDVVWKSSNPLAVSVDQDGNIHANATGKATITASTDKGRKKTSCTITAKFTLVSSVKLNKTSGTLSLKQTYQLKATVAPSLAYNKTLQWTSSVPSVATVDENGLIVPLKDGKTRITAMATDGSKKKATCDVTVKTIRVTSLKLNASTTRKLPVDMEYQLAAKILPTNAHFPEVEWISSAPDVASVDENGLVKALAPGRAMITASSDRGLIKASCPILVPTGGKPVHRALVLGSFSTRSIPGYLPFVNGDVNGVRSALLSSSIGGERYQMVNSANPVGSSEQIKNLVSQTFAHTTDSDVSLIYMVTHGKVGSVSFEGALTMTYKEFIEILRPIKGDIVVIISACNSGSFIDLLNSSYRNDEISARLHVLCAAQSGVTACGLKDTTEAKSLDFFTYSMLLGLGKDIRNGTDGPCLADKNSDGIVTFGELATYTKAKTPSVIKSYISSKGSKAPFSGHKVQVPMYFGSNADLPVG